MSTTVLPRASSPLTTIRVESTPSTTPSRLTETIAPESRAAVLRGTLEMDGMIGPPPRNVAIGSYHVEMPDPTASGTAAGVLSARVNDKEGPLSFEGRLTLSPDRSFLLEGTVAPRGSTSASLAQSLQYLGPPDASGRRPVSVSGTL